MRNKFITLLSFLILLGGSLCYGQENSINVNGIVTDSLTQIGIPYATVEFVSQGNTEQRGGFVADEEGRFSQHFPIPGEYRLTVRSVGYKTKLLTIEVHQGTNRVDTIRLFPDTQELGEVKVVARRKLIALSPKGLTYDMKNDVLAQTDNLLFALRNVPLVSVDGEGNIRVKGSSNFSVYINGTPSRVASMNPTEVLRGIPANTIKRVEVITQLDARYDASAGDAILNIITDRKTLDGCSATVSLAGTTIPKANGATTLTLTKGKLSVALAYNYDYTRHKDQPVDVYRRTFEGDKTIDEFRSSQKNGVGIFRNHVGSLMGEYTLDSLNTIYADGHIFVSSTNSTGTNKQTFSRLGVPTQYSSLNNKMNYTEGSVEGNLLYRNLYASDYAQLVVRAKFLLHVQFTEKNVAYVYTTMDKKAEYGVDDFTLSRGMVNSMADMRGVDIWVNFTESDKGVLCELRSSHFNINPIAVKYGGGGHMKASGATLKNREEAMAMLHDLDEMMGESK